jgi:probable HAF family extracellular repeat protein
MPARCFTLLALLALAPAARAQVLYFVTELPPPPNSQYSYNVQAVNNAGQTAGLGTTTFPGIPPFTVIRTTPGAASQDLGTGLGQQVSQTVFSLNGSGQVSATLFIAGNSHAARYTDGSGWLDLGTLPGNTMSAAAGINNAGQVVGVSSGGTAPQLPFRYTNGVGMQGLPLPPGATSGSGMAINNRGQVAVDASVSGIGRAFRYTDGSGYQDLGSLGGTATQANAINDAGQVVGYSRNAAGVARPFLYTDGVGMVDLGTLPGGTGGTAEAINALSVLVGSADTSGGSSHAFVYRNGMMIDLNTLIGPSLGWTLTEANGINDNGLIVGRGTLNGRQTSFLLTPVPEPSSLALVAVGAGALCTWYRRRRCADGPETAG